MWHPLEQHACPCGPPTHASPVLTAYQATYRVGNTIKTLRRFALSACDSYAGSDAEVRCRTMGGRAVRYYSASICEKTSCLFKEEAVSGLDI